ncbi:MAG: DUF2334 domain-containing protein, partial [Planctomycetes bacterium]|nr:DUF2334 domain-containing protein [Planctomycetota bacterium]
TMQHKPKLTTRRRFLKSASSAAAGAVLGIGLTQSPSGFASERTRKRTRTFIFTCDDVGLGRHRESVERFEAVVRWLERKQIPGTFFWVPKAGNRRAEEDKLWRDAIDQARRTGHDFQLHGLTHHCLEFGVPQKSIRRHAPKMFEQYEREREKWEKEHTVRALRAKFDEAVAIYEQAFGERPLVFRAPCFGICPNAYRAMFECGIRYSSSRSVNPAATGYVLTRKPKLKPWQPDYPGRPFEEPPGVLEIPTLEDLTIRGVPPGDRELILRLFKRDITHYLDALGDWPYGVLTTHYHSIGRQFDEVTSLYDELLDWLAAQGITQWTTFKGALS